MRTRKTVKMTTAILGLLGVAFLASGLTISPVRWTQEVLLASLGVRSADIVHAAQPQEGALTTDSPLQLAKVLGRLAGKKGESPEEKEIGNLGKPVPPGQIHKRSKTELLDQCNKLARCKAKLQAAKKGKRPAKVLPAGKKGESPEEKALSKIPKPAKPTPRYRQQKSELGLPDDNATLLSWLNPFAVPSAHAQSAFSLYLAPPNRYSSSPYGFFKLYGAAYWGSYYLYGGGHTTIRNTNSENKPMVYFGTTVPADGWYLINVQGGRGKAKLRHRSNGPIIETWDFTTQSCYRCDYLTAEYLTAGYHYFYFWPDGSNMYFYSMSVDSY